MKVKIDIFSGFLGAGKTMLIKKLIEEKLNKNKIVIIENEFGEVGIDGTVLKKSNLAVKEINAGCICCTVNGDFKKAIKEAIMEYAPDRIIIEPSGVGKLSEIINLCQAQELRNLIQLNMVITVVDVLKYHSYINNFGEFYKDQIINTSTIVLSRTQNIGKDKVDNVLKDIRQINNNAIIITTSWHNIEASKIIDVCENSKNQCFKEELKKFKLSTINSNKTIKFSNRSLNHRHNADEVFQTWGIETSKLFNKNKITTIFNNIEKTTLYGQILRAKGILQVSEREWVQFDYVPGEMNMNNIEADYSSRLCVIGSNLNGDMLNKIFVD
ncbi:GTP-binding protein [Clostridium sp. DJ247]|uniref:CobW family GTP-binding protein n=1 Tax=Clostridium sp. DJ247 TaxID=2726188 RepID=UPI0016267204|nr:GTP-binding protein [Clostridium sp. DJ247]MBC2582188.1 GTP-binding protein [Clostridium sp. DJ247]